MVQEERAKSERFKKVGVHEYISRAGAANVAQGKWVKAIWVRVNTGSLENPEIPCGWAAESDSTSCLQAHLG